MVNVISLVLYISAMLFSPGPNNMMLMTTGSNFGYKKGLSHLLGVCFGFTAMGFLVSLGFGFIFEKFPLLQTIIRIVGLVYMLYLAWFIAGRPFLKKSGSHTESSCANKTEGTTEEKISVLKSDVKTDYSEGKSRITFWKAALFQWINPKAWIAISVAIASYSSSLVENPLSIPVIMLLFFCVSLVSSHVWLIFGSVFRLFLQVPRRKRLFNYFMAGMLVVLMIPVIVEMINLRI